MHDPHMRIRGRVFDISRYWRYTNPMCKTKFKITEETVQTLEVKQKQLLERLLQRMQMKWQRHRKGADQIYKEAKTIAVSQLRGHILYGYI